MIRQASIAAAAALPAPDVVEDARIGPLLGKSDGFLHRFAADAKGVDLALRRWSAAEGYRLFSDVLPIGDDFAEAAFIPGTTIFAGPWFNHFGHMIPEGIHRLWGALLPAYRDARILFLTKRGAPAIPVWAERLFAQFGIGSDRLLFHDRPARYERLVVPRQGRCLGGGLLLDHYMDVFPLIETMAVPGKGPPIYLSRGMQTDTGSYLGEHLIERVLAQAGFEIVHPEIETLDTVVTKVVAAESVIVSEGSAIHNLELCGRIAGRVFLIGRRYGTKHFHGILAASSAESALFAPGKQLFSLDRNPRDGSESVRQVCTFIDLPMLIDELATFTGRSLRMPEKDVVREAVALDLGTYLMRPGAGASATDAELGATLRRVRGFRGLQALLGGALPKPSAARG